MTSGRWAVAEAAMRSASVQVRPLETVEQMTQACRLLDDVWEIPPEETSEVRPSLLRGLGQAGNYLAAAYVTGGPRAGEMVAASVGFFAPPAEASLHSHITGVRPRSGHGIGRAIKWHQRAWSLDRGLRRISWTYDPLIARNAFFNLTRLGARPRRYFVDFYGPMDDGPNRGQPTDRADIEWDLRSDATMRAAAEVLDPATTSAGPDVDALRSAGAIVALSVGSSGEPVVGRLPGSAGPLLVGVPADIEGLRRYDQALALRWRLNLRSVLAPLMNDEPWQVTGFAKSGWYVLEQVDPAQDGGQR